MNKARKLEIEKNMVRRKFPEVKQPVMAGPKLGPLGSMTKKRTGKIDDVIMKELSIDLNKIAKLVPDASINYIKMHVEKQVNRGLRFVLNGEDTDNPILRPGFKDTDNNT